MNDCSIVCDSHLARRTLLLVLSSKDPLLHLAPALNMSESGHSGASALQLICYEPQAALGIQSQDQPEDASVIIFYSENFKIIFGVSCALW